MKSGIESIVGYNRGFRVTLRVLGWYLILSAAAMLAGAILGPLPWGVPIYYRGLSVFLAWLMFRTARPFSQTFVALGPEGVRLGLLNFNGGKWTPLPEQRFQWAEIGSDITYDSYKGVCRFRARNLLYELNDNISPSPRTVAKLMAERRGVQLLDQAALAPPGQRPMAKMKLAKILAGIGLPMTGAAVVGGFWLNSRPMEAPHYDYEPATVAVVGIVGVFFLLLPAIALAVSERSHRLKP